jgi:hypothetical protein
MSGIVEIGIVTVVLVVIGLLAKFIINLTNGEQTNDGI